MKLRNKILLSLIVHFIWMLVFICSYVLSLNPSNPMIFAILWNENIILSMIMFTFIVHFVVFSIYNKKPLENYDDERRFKIINSVFTMVIWLPLIFLLYGECFTFIILIVFVLLIIMVYKK